MKNEAWGGVIRKEENDLQSSLLRKCCQRRGIMELTRPPLIPLDDVDIYRTDVWEKDDSILQTQT